MGAGGVPPPGLFNTHILGVNESKIVFVLAEWKGKEEYEEMPKTTCYNYSCSLYFAINLSVVCFN